MLRIGLTGGIASGKSAAAAAFAALGVTVIDADHIARELVTPGSPILEDVLAAFGERYRQADGHLDRKALGSRVFADADARRRLEAITHPAIRTELMTRAQDAAGPYVIVMVPLLVETGMIDLVDRVLVVDVSTEVQKQRLAARDGFDAQRIDQILAAQANRQDRLAAADDVIDNNGDLAHLKEQVLARHEAYLALAAEA